MTVEKAILYKAEKLDNLLIFQAHYQKFSFDRHSHEDFALGLMDEGVQTFHCRGTDFYAAPASMLTVNPGEVHDGRSANSKDYRYKIIYIPFDLLQKIGREMVAPKTSHFFRLPVTVDKTRAVMLAQLFALLTESDADPLQIQEHFTGLIRSLLRVHGTAKNRVSLTEGMPHTITKAVQYINDMATDDISLDDLAAVAGLSRYHFLHLFTATMGISPYAMLLNRRLQLAKTALAMGYTIADAALEAGFADQSHLSRRFKAAFGITPGQYRRAMSG